MFDYHYGTNFNTSSQKKIRCTYPPSEKNIHINIFFLTYGPFQNYCIMEKNLISKYDKLINKAFNLTKPKIRKTCPKVTFYE